MIFTTEGCYFTWKKYNGVLSPAKEGLFHALEIILVENVFSVFPKLIRTPRLPFLLLPNHSSIQSLSNQLGEKNQ